MQVLVSVIITTKNEEKNIEDCLTSIINQSYPRDKIEIIVVDNNSSDKTKEIARKYTEKVINYGPERSAQRNFGVKQAQGKYILYLDADMILSKDVIKECVQKSEEGKDTVALYIPEEIIGKGFWIKVRNFERSFYNATCIDAVRFVRRDKFLEIGGFDEALIAGEDWDFDRRIRRVEVVDIINSILCHNEGRFSLKTYLNKKKYYTKSLNSYIDKWGCDDKIIKKQCGFWYRYFGVFFVNGKWVRSIMHPVLVLEIYILKGLVGLIYMLNCKKTYDK